MTYRTKLHKEHKELGLKNDINKKNKIELKKGIYFVIDLLSFVILKRFLIKDNDGKSGGKKVGDFAENIGKTIPAVRYGVMEGYYISIEGGEYNKNKLIEHLLELLYKNGIKRNK